MDPYIGQIQLFAFNFAPSGWLPCQGQQLQIAQNQALYALIGITYGGNGSTYFNLPDLRGAEPVPGNQYCIAIQGLFPTRD